MFNHISYSMTAASTGRQLSGSIDYTKGLTVITGRNEAGKTTLGIEMPRYALFGTKALRGQLADYLELSVTFTFTAAGKRYTVFRGKGERLVNDKGEVLAVKPDAVNTAILGILGFGLEVFDVVCAALQFDATRLTDMLPSERKAMINKLVGLDLLEVVEKDCRGEATVWKRTAAAAAANLSPPEPLDNYMGRPRPTIETDLAEARRVETRRAVLQAQTHLPVMPLAPSAPRPTNIADLEQQYAGWVSYEVARKSLALRILPMDPPHDLQDIQQAEAWQDYADECERRGPRPSLSEEVVAASAAEWAAHDNWVESEPCPACGYQATASVRPGAPTHSKAFLQEQTHALYRWATPLVAPPKGPVVGLQSRADISRARDLLNRKADSDEAREELAQLLPVSDPTEELKTARALLDEWTRYDAQREYYDERKAEAAPAEAELAGLPPVDVAGLEDELREAVEYERLLDRFEQEQALYEQGCALVDEAETTSAEFKEGADLLRDVRMEFQANLAPTVAREACGLLETMTGGARTLISIDEDFNILVDGQPTRTLSGSAKVVANLAIRVALGRILTGTVLPVFLGDEIDASMDADRAGSTVEAMRGLCSVLEQVVLVSHKELEGDTVVCL